MNCNDALNLIAARVDRQPLVPAHEAELDQHLAGCTACREELAQQQALSAALREKAETFRMPSHVRARLSASLPRESAPAPRTARPFLPWFPAFGSVGALQLGSAFAAGAVLMLALQFTAAGYSTRNAGLDEAVSAHVRSLMADHLEDVASSDHHTVKPWFAGKLDFSPPVIDLAEKGFPLAGGRLDYLGGRDVAALVYRHQQHIINVFVWPSAVTTSKSPEAAVRQGYNTLHWQAGGMVFYAVTDMNPAELKTFAEALSASN